MSNTGSKRILIVSNGHGEDIIGQALGCELLKLGYSIDALPLVGHGHAYETGSMNILGPRKAMPSGGFVFNQRGAFWKDLQAGWFSMSLQQWSTLKQASRNALATLAVGDIYSLAVSSLFGVKPLFQIQCLVSVRAWQPSLGRAPYGIPELLLMQGAARVYPREQEGLAWLQTHGVSHSLYLGNPMLDALTGTAFLDVPGPYLLLLPGSRSDAYQSLPVMLEACRLLNTPLTPLVAWSSQPLLPIPQWSITPTGLKEGVTHVLERAGTKVYLAQNSFKTALLQSRLALSTSGTAAEQAAGYGIPLVVFPTSGPQYTLGFAQAQTRLLGEALHLVPADPSVIAEHVRRVDSPEARTKAQQAGTAAMGQPGSAYRIAQDIHRYLQILSPDT
jgi:uncharacterized protein (TIGR03492 family)